MSTAKMTAEERGLIVFDYQKIVLTVENTDFSSFFFFLFFFFFFFFLYNNYYYFVCVEVLRVMSSATNLPNYTFHWADSVL